MTTIAFAEICQDPPSVRLVITVPDLLWSHLRRRRQRRLYARLARLSPHIIRDIGLDPDDVRAAVAGPFDPVVPGR